MRKSHFPSRRFHPEKAEEKGPEKPKVFPVLLPFGQKNLT